jgi:DNA mismatch repair protein MutS2
VLLKAVGLLAAMTQAGIVPPVGSGTRLPIFTGFFTDIGDRQSIAADLSTFSAHVATLRRILDGADGGSLILLDELGSGTDPAEGAALAWAVLEALTRRGALTIATTHLGTLKTLASSVPGVVNGSLEFDPAGLSPTYRFTKGVPGRSYGLAIARRLGLDPALVDRATARVPAQERALDALLEAVEGRRRAVEAREAAVEGWDKEITARETTVGAREAAVAEREREARRREREAVWHAQEQARAYLLRARQTVEEALRRAEAPRSDAAREARRLVENAIREADQTEGAAVGSEEEERTGAAVEAGARVRVGSGALGVVEEVRGDGKITVITGNVRMVVPRDAVVALPGGAGRREGRATPGLGTAPAGPRVEAPFQIDLRGMRVDEAEAATIAALDAAVSADHPYLRIIHGRGTGAVRERVHRIVQADRRVARFALAPQAEGGAGVTVVELAP